MVEKSKKKQTYRHTPAFILLFLAMEDLYGAALLKMLKTKLPHYHTDSAIVYRSLQELEDDGLVTFYWETDTPGPAKKWYKITDKGMNGLGEFKKDIEMRMKNLEYFLNAYKEVIK
jgi:PadR family transcriptional regulator PadR